MTKVLTIVGTRPEVIRLSRVIARLDATVDHVLVHTGQNYDFALNGIFFDELNIRSPDHFLNVDVSSLGTVLAGVLTGTERVLQQERPEAVLVLGDTNSCLAAVMAKRMRIPVYHMEAGNRCFDENVPEETNRRLVDHVADFNLVYSEHARRNLLAEGIHPRRVTLTGSPIREVVNHYRSQIESSVILERLHLERHKYLLVSAHREENVDSARRLGQLLDCLEAARTATSLPVVMSTHPRTRRRLDELGRKVPGVDFHPPLGFLDYNKLQSNAYCVLSDSGTIAEESAALKFPAVTLRNSVERPEAIDAGALLMSDLNAVNMVEAMMIAAARDTVPMVPDYEIANCSERAVNFIISTCARNSQWHGYHAPIETP